MEYYLVTGRMIDIHTGVLALEKEQAQRRAHNLERTSKKGKQYNILNPIQFKQGESFGYDGDLPKRLAHLVRNMKEIEAEKEALQAKVEAAEQDAQAKPVDLLRDPHADDGEGA